MKSLRALGVLAVASLALLAGCSGSSSGSAASLPEDNGGVAAQPANGGADYADKAPEDVPAGVPDVIVEQKLARTARVSLTVTDVEAAATQLRALAASLDGQVTAENLVSRVGADAKVVPTSTMVISVPADRLDSALEQLKSVGTITNRVITTEDVTLQVADVDARIKTLNDSIARLRDLWSRAGRISELTQLENEIQTRISERDSLVAQQNALAKRVAQSPITLTLTLPADAPVAEATGFLGGLVAGWNALLASSRVLMTVLGAVLPFAAVVAVIGLPLMVWRRRRRHPSATATPATQPAEPPSADDQADAG
ncbi:MAG: DUF4349 domain-containing protein [Actinobacteria bacterium]|nr:DUF4349 domain-containing protein [Actinomycetota bacterium]